MEKESSLSVHKNSGKEGKKYDSSISLAFQDLLQCSLQKSCRKRVIFSPRNEEKIMRAWDALLRFLFYPFDSSKSRVYTTLNVCSLVPTAVLFVKRAQKRGEEKEDFCTRTTRQKKKKAAKVFFSLPKKVKEGGTVAYLRVRSAWGYYYQIFILFFPSGILFHQEPLL